MSVIKKTKPATRMTPLCFQSYYKEPKLCAVSHATKYVKEQKSKVTQIYCSKLVLNLKL